MKRNQKILRTTFLSVFLFLFAIIGHAQTKDISGTVIDESGEAIPGVAILVPGTTIGVVTSVDGVYSLSVPENTEKLMFSFIGMSVQEIVIGAQTTINVTMATDAIGLDEIVAIGYGTSKKRDLTGAIVNVQAEDFIKYQPSSVSELLRSAAPGLKVGYSSNAKNTPGFMVRGDNSLKADLDDDAEIGDNEINEENVANRPLIILDGVIFNGDLAEINVNDVESVDVLKDASSASIYGSRAANGVIVFTTKKGAIGKPVIRASAKVGVITSSRRIKTFKGGDEVMNWLTDMNESITDQSTAEWSKFDKYENVPSQYQSAWLDENSIPGETNPTEITNAWLNTFGFEPNEKENYMAGTVYDWQDFLFHTGIRQDYDFSVSGRTDRVAYYWSLGYIDSESVQVGDEYSSITSRLNLDVKVADFMSVGLNANFAYEDQGGEPTETDGYRTLSPYDMPWNNGVERTRENLKDAGAGSNRSNPYLDPAYITRKFDRYKLMPSMYAKVKLPLGINITSRYTKRLDFRQRLRYEDSANPQWGHGGEVERMHNQLSEWQLDNILNWDLNFGEHRFAITGLVNAERLQTWQTKSGGSNFSPTESLGFHHMGLALIPTASSEDEAITRNALMGRVNYSFGNRYNLSASMRRDGYSRFGEDNVYATFPSISGAWTISNEAFMASAPSWLSFLKLRASWGVNGNSAGLQSYAANAMMGGGKFLNYSGGYYVVPSLTIDRLANPALSWEKNDAFNFAVDYGFLDGRVRGAIDVYSSETTDLILDKILPTLTGIDRITTNVGGLRNQGIDLSINATIAQSSDFMWTSSFNLHYNKNKILSLTGEKFAVNDADGNPVLDGNGNPVMEEQDDLDNEWFIGKSKDVIWDYDVDGVYGVDDAEEAAQYNFYPGDFRVVDQNGDGVLNTQDKVFLGQKSNPWYLTLRNDFEYKNFDLGVIFISKLGYKDNTSEPFNQSQSYIKNHNWYNLPYWTPNNQINDAARINSIRYGGMDIWTPKSYLRFQNISLGYNIPEDILESIKVSRARLAFSVDNVAVWTNWIQGDPESTREMPRTYSFSVDFSF
jgi:TonB-linked SusC/RagA family outer membrane protein